MLREYTIGPYRRGVVSTGRLLRLGGGEGGEGGREGEGKWRRRRKRRRRGREGWRGGIGPDEEL